MSLEQVPFQVLGSNFAPVGGVVTVRLEAISGTPFLAGTSRFLDAPGEILSTGRIDAVLPLARINSEVVARVHVLVPGGVDASWPANGVTVTPTLALGARPGNRHLVL